MRTMRCLFALILVLVLVLGLPAAAVADGQMSPKPGEQAASTPATPWYREKRAAEPCWGDSMESDADLNDGSRITTEEILRILHPAQS